MIGVVPGRVRGQKHREEEPRVGNGEDIPETNNGITVLICYLSFELLRHLL